MTAPISHTIIPPAPPRQWPIRLDDYDRSARLSPIEQRVLTDGLDQALARERKTNAVLDRLHGIERRRPN